MIRYLAAFIILGLYTKGMLTFMPEEQQIGELKKYNFTHKLAWKSLREKKRYREHKKELTNVATEIGCKTTH